MQTESILCVPDIGDAPRIELVSWYVSEGDVVSQGQELCELVTEKAAFPLESPQKGRIKKIYKPSGAIVKVKEVLLELEMN